MNRSGYGKITLLILVVFTTKLIANANLLNGIGIQDRFGAYPDSLSDPPAKERLMVTFGVLQGGRSILGLDMELLLNDRIGLQVGGGLFGGDVGINVHLTPGLRGTLVSLQLIRQGFGNGYLQTIAGGMLVFRTKKWFTFSLGAGYRLHSDPQLMKSQFYNASPLVLLGSLGFYKTIEW